jgi:hypothetical protein
LNSHFLVKKWFFPSATSKKWQTVTSAGTVTLGIKLRRPCPKPDEYQQATMNEECENK